MMSNTTRRLFLSRVPALAAVAGLFSRSAAVAAPLETLTEAEREELLDAYDEWLYFERRMLHVERFGLERVNYTENFIPCTAAHNYHFPMWGEPPAPTPSTRAMKVLAAVDCSWRDENVESLAETSA